MNDNALITALSAQLVSSITSAGWDFIVVQKDQPTQEGVPSAPTVYLEKLFDHDYGFPIVSQSYDSDTNIYTQTEKQVVETTFQISALVPQNPSDLTIPTAADVVKQVKLWVQTRVTIAALMAQSISMYRVSEVRAEWFTDDSEQFENNPNFDIVLQHEDSVTMVIPAATSAVGKPSAVPSQDIQGNPLVGPDGEPVYKGSGTIPVL